MSIQDFGHLFQFIGGLGMFLYGMNVMADGLQKSAGNKMKPLLGALTKNRLLAVLVGTLITALIQSSSATTVMVVGFVNAGIINLTQAVGIIMGANIGTTVTSWIVSLNEWGSVLKPEFFAPLLLGIGAFSLLFSKTERKKEVGSILIGFGTLFIGLSYMSSSIGVYKDAKIFSDAFRILGNNPLLGILAGAVITGIIQSSSASVGILQTLAANGVVTWNSAIFITLGQNIGTCVTALISSAGAHKTAKRAAAIHLIFNILGAVIFGVIMFVFFMFNKSFAASHINSVQISIFHSIFNITCTVLLFPFANQLVRLSGVLIKDDTEEKEDVIGEAKLRLDSRLLETPSFAIETTAKEVFHMGQYALENVNLAIRGIVDNNKKCIDLIYENEEIINDFEKIITEYLVSISQLSLNSRQHQHVKDMLNIVRDLERVGDHCINLAELSESKMKEQLQFSISGMEDMEQIGNAALAALEHALRANRKEDLKEVDSVNRFEETVDALEEQLRDKHILRLVENKCNIEAGVIFLDAISNLERIADHAYNIAGYTKTQITRTQG